MAFATRQGFALNGQPRTIYTSYSPVSVSFVLALSVAAGLAEPGEDATISVATLPGTRTYRYTHRGPYAELARTYGRITAFMLEKGLMRSEADWPLYMPMWEESANDPRTTPPAELLTYIHLPVSGA
jgi:AraC family transcriptional regulator